MGLSSVLNRWLNRLYKSIAILLVVFAALISGLRLFLPYAHNYRVDLQNYINSTYSSNIVIGEINMGWGNLGPTLFAENVSLLQTDTSEIFIEQIDIDVDFWGSLKARQFITGDFTLSGAKVMIDSTSIEGGSEQDATMINSIVDLFLQQIDQFSLVSSQVILKTAQQQSTFIISQLNWINDGEHHIAQGEVTVDGLTSNNLKLRIDVNGNDNADMEGTVYLEANELNITPWLDRVLAIENEKTDSSINFNAWLSIKAGEAQQVKISLGHNEIQWQHQDKNQKLVLESGQIIATDLDNFNQYTFHSSPLEVFVNDQAWQPLSIESRTRNNTTFTYLSFIDLAGVSKLLPLFERDEATLALVEKLNLSGALNEIYLQTGEQKIQLSADFNQVTSHFSQGIPGVENINGDLLFSGDKLQLNLTAEQGHLDFDKHFMQPIPYQKISATFNAHKDNNGWSITSKALHLASEEISLSADLAVDIPENGKVNLSLLAAVNDVDVKYAEHYYPHLAMKKNLRDYLKKALISGKVTQAQVLFNGNLTDFPFIDHQGVFATNAELTQSTFQFDPKWPDITDFQANLNFTNSGRLVTGRSGSLVGIDVTGVKAEITDLAGLLDKQVLSIDAKLHKTAPSIVADLMKQSPMEATVGSVLTQLQASNPITGGFQLSLPLKNPEQALAKGFIDFKNNDLLLQKPSMQFTQLNGQLTFENNVIRADDLTARWQGLPLNVTVDASDKKDYYGTNILIDADWQDKIWLEKVPELLKKYAKGNLAWQGDLNLNSHHDGGFSYNLDINSNLKQASLKLPEPYAKLADEHLPLSVKVTGQLNQSTFNATLGEQLNFYGVLNHQDVQFSIAHLMLGNEKMLLPMDGFHITAKLDDASVSQWQPFVLDIIDTVKSQHYQAQDKQSQVTQSGSSFKPLLAKPERIRGSVAKLDIFGQSLSNVSFNLLDKEAWWLLQLNAKEARSQIKFYPDWHQDGIDINADFLHLVKDETEAIAEELVVEDTSELASATNPEITLKAVDKVITKFDITKNNEVFANIPPMRFHCDSCRLGDLDLGVVDFSVSKKNKETIELKQFIAKRDKSQLTFDGIWQHNNQISQTSLTGELSTKDVEHEIEKLGFSSIIKDSGVKSKYVMNWQGAPYDFSLETIDADLSVNFDDGYLADVNDKGARFLSVLSLESLLRKLTLDFRDIFSKGMFYSDIKGDFTVEKGHLYTKNTKMKGAAGDLSIKGNTKLTEGLLDYRMSYKPNLTSSLPVIAWIATLNPVTFLAGIALDQVITSKVVSELNFELTGSVEDPNIKEVNRKSQNIRVGRSTPPEVVDDLSNNENSQPVDSQNHNPKNLIPQNPIYKDDLFDKNQPLDNFNG